ncbi:hypothetical protein F0562_026479 [Nyssa sinensis]|uniref:C2H2-type domain-containing protein n=1 Tax=Nyssa sinensis TaxID=561372 RepID=A0A5J5BDH1_9ASTE|nr:hypothetical protein F0562_026479 [Nyssa sinensis]
MRTHLAFLPIPPKLNDSIKLDTSSSLHSGRAQEDTSLTLGSRKNLDKSPQKLTRRRSKRNWKLIDALVDLLDEPKSTSLVSINSPVEDVALSILMLSKGKGTYRKVEEEKGKERVEENKEEANEDENGGYMEDDDDNDDDDADNDKDDDYALYLTQTQPRAQVERTHRYETRKKAFQSHQALERCGEKQEEIKVQIQETNEVDFGGDIGNIGKKIHKCPSCSRVFKSGQALGGHKKIHASSSRNAINSDAFGGHFIDLQIHASSSQNAINSDEFGGHFIDLDLSDEFDGHFIDLNFPPPEEV